MYEERNTNKRFRYKAELPANRNRQRLAGYLAGRSNRVRSQLEDWLGGEVKITGRVDAKGKRCTMTFTDANLGVVGQTDLLFSGSRVMPGEVRSRVYAGPAVSSGCAGGAADIEARRDLMQRISRKAEELFLLSSRWHVSYYNGGDLIGAKVITGENMTGVKGVAYHGAPPETDMIKLVTPDGNTLVRTAKKRWTREDKTARPARQSLKE